MHGAVGEVGEALVVGHHADRRSGLVQVPEQLHHGVAVRGVEVARRLVRQEDARPTRQGSGHRDALLLATAQLAGQVAGPMAHPDLLQALRRPLPPFSRRHPAIDERQLDVLEDGEISDEVEALEDETDLAVPDPRPLRQLEARSRPGVEDVRPRGGRVEESQDGQERRLPAPRGPADGDELALADLEVDVGKGVGLDLVRREDLLEPFELDERLRHGSSFRAQFVRGEIRGWGPDRYFEAPIGPTPVPCQGAGRGEALFPRQWRGHDVPYVGRTIPVPGTASRPDAGSRTRDGRSRFRERHATRSHHRASIQSPTQLTGLVQPRIVWRLSLRGGSSALRAPRRTDSQTVLSALTRLDAVARRARSATWFR